jgi:hypothetical protein
MTPARIGALLLAIGLGCGGAVANKLSPLEGYSQASPDAPPFEEISATCQQQAAFHDARGTSWTDWEQFENCMNEHGWQRAPKGASNDASVNGGT